MIVVKTTSLLILLLAAALDPADHAIIASYKETKGQELEKAYPFPSKMKLDFRGRKKKQGEANFCSLIPLMLFLTRQQRGKATGKSKVFSMHFILGTQLITRRQ